MKLTMYNRLGEELENVAVSKDVNVGHHDDVREIGEDV